MNGFNRSKTMTTTQNSMTSLVLAVLASGSILAFAAAPAEAASVDVAVSGYSLTSAQGRAAVDARVTAAAEKACDAGADIRDVAAWTAEKACVEKAIADARAQVAALGSKTRMAGI
jgi:UrcA family protein